MIIGRAARVQDEHFRFGRWVALSLLILIWAVDAQAAVVPAWPLDDSGIDWWAGKIGDQNFNFLTAPPVDYPGQDASFGRDKNRHDESDGQAGFCGAGDWRLPSREELRSIVDYGRTRPALDTQYFPDDFLGGGGNFWSFSSLANRAASAWYVYFYNGSDGYVSKGSAFRVRLVRGGQDLPVAKADQSIAFGSAPALTVGGTTTLTATGGASGNPVTFSSQTPAVCITGGTNGATIAGVAIGTCTIAADQAGSDRYNPAPQVHASFTVKTGICLECLPNRAGWRATLH